MGGNSAMILWKPTTQFHDDVRHLPLLRGQAGAIRRTEDAQRRNLGDSVIGFQCYYVRYVRTLALAVQRKKDARGRPRAGRGYIFWTHSVK